MLLQFVNDYKCVFYLEEADYNSFKELIPMIYELF